MLMRAATVLQQLCKSCRTCFMFYCIFYFTCDRSLSVSLPCRRPPYVLTLTQITTPETSEPVPTAKPGRRRHGMNTDSAVSTPSPAGALLLCDHRPPKLHRRLYEQRRLIELLHPGSECDGYRTLRPQGHT